MGSFILKRKTYSSISPAESLILGAGVFGGAGLGGYIGNKLGNRAVKNNAKQKAEENFNPGVEIKKNKLEAARLKREARNLRKQYLKAKYPDTELEEADEYDAAAEYYTKKARDIMKDPESARKTAGQEAYNTAKDPETVSKYTRKGILNGTIVGGAMGLGGALGYALKKKIV